MNGPRDQEASTPLQQPGGPDAAFPARPDPQVAPPPGRMPPLPPPSPVRLSSWAWLAGAAVGLLALAYSMSQLDELHRRLADSVRTQRPGIESELLDRAVGITIYVGLGGAIALILAQLLLAVLMLTGRNWARVLLVLVAVLGLAWTVFSLVTMVELVRAALPLQALIASVATVLMFQPGANSWFRRRAA